MEATYEAWLHAYSEALERTSFSMYRFSGQPHSISFSPVTPFGQLGARRGIFQSMWHGISSFSLFPYTDVLPQRSMDLTPDEEAILNDWAVTGSDLYRAYRGCKILSQHGPNPRTAEAASSVR